MKDKDKKKVSRLPVTMKASAEDSKVMLVPPPHDACRHWKSSFTVDMDAGICRCKQCGGEVSAMFVLKQLMHEESRWNQTRESYQDEMKRLKARSRTKCTHCGEITRISGR